MKSFGAIEKEKIIAEDDSFMVIFDKYPVSLGHSLIITKHQKARFRELTQEEQATLVKWIDWTVRHLEKNLNPKPDGFNMGMNDGEAAGQTMGQFHFHIIPRYNSDAKDPRGGIRWIVPNKAKYWD
jgi:diadenosine tetraphosphate (Ap4A) HIT family hydrolase